MDEAALRLFKTVMCHAKKANAHSSTFGFADLQGQYEKPKELEISEAIHEHQRKLRLLCVIFANVDEKTKELK